jgi:plastocyanin
MRLLIPLALALVLAVAGCGGDDSGSGSGSGGGGSGSSSSSSSSSGGGGQQLALAAPEDGTLKFDKTTLKAKPGEVTINLDNPSPVPHAVEIEGNGVEEESEQVTGGKASVSADLKAGTYTFYCPVGSHREQGMEGKLTVG